MDCAEVVNEYRDLSTVHDVELAACGTNQSCIERHLTLIAAAEVSGSFADVTDLLSRLPRGLNGYQETFRNLQYQTAENIASGATFDAAWHNAGKQFEYEFKNTSCNGLSTAECGVAFNAEVKRLADDVRRRTENLERLEAFLGGVGVVVDLTPVGDAVATVQCASTLDASTCTAAAVGWLGPIGDGAKILLRRGDVVIEVIADGKKGFNAPNKGPRITIRDHYEHHKAMTDDLKLQLRDQGYRVSDKEISFGSSCGTGRCRPDIVYETPDGKWGIIEVKTGNADLT
ncbi:hypothetical protein RKLH11_4351, partial [Rhodobacteraceae bacterium KLH11]